MNSLKRKPSNVAGDCVNKTKIVTARENVATEGTSIVVCVCVLRKILIIVATKKQHVFCNHILDFVNY